MLRTEVLTIFTCANLYLGVYGSPINHGRAVVHHRDITIPLRIMPLGASVTFGVGSSLGNSYRKDLRDMLVETGNEVDMVGEVRNGDFEDNQCEAFSGYVVDQLAEKSTVATPKFKPNVILVDLGTNNCNQGQRLSQFGAQVKALINKMYAESPGVTVILATVYPNPDARQDECRVDVNKQYQAIAGEFEEQGAKFVLVDMRVGGPTVNDLADGRHPNDRGYNKMAKVWFSGIEEAQGKGFISNPEM